LERVLTIVPLPRFQSAIPDRQLCFQVKTYQSAHLFSLEKLINYLLLCRYEGKALTLWQS
jgi:hypothetical protein